MDPILLRGSTRLRLGVSMKQYWEIPGPSRAPNEPCIAFRKEDGSNFRAEWLSGRRNLTHLDGRDMCHLVDRLLWVDRTYTFWKLFSAESAKAYARQQLAAFLLAAKADEALAQGQKIFGDKKTGEVRIVVDPSKEANFRLKGKVDKVVVFIPPTQIKTICHGKFAQPLNF